MDERTQATKGKRWATRFNPSNGRVLVDTSGNIWSEADMKAGIPLGPGEWDLLLDQIEESNAAPEPRGEPEPSAINDALAKLREAYMDGEADRTSDAVGDLLDVWPPEGWKEAPEPDERLALLAEELEIALAGVDQRVPLAPPVFDSLQTARAVVQHLRPVPPSPRTEKVPVLDAIAEGRQVTSDDGAVLMDLSNGDVLLYRSGGRFRLMFDDAGHAEERRPAVDADGCVLVLARSDEGGQA